jgi:alpha-1,2-mannosyltransferase
MVPRAALLRHVLPAVALVLAIAVLFGVARRAADGRQAILKWQPAFAEFEAGISPYGRPEGAVPAGGEGEGYPTLPLSAVLMSTLLAAGPVLGSVLFAALKLALAAWSFAAAVDLARRAGWPFPPWAQAALLTLWLRVVLSDVNHGNTNLLVCACVVGAAWAYARGREASCGAAIGAGALLKVTPLLLLGIALRRGTGRAALGFLTALALGGLLLPGLVYGFEFNLRLIGEFGRQMLAPYLAGADPGPMQTQQINQSLFGWLARLFTDGVAIAARGETWAEDVRITLWALPAETFRWVHRGAALGVLAVFGWAVLRYRERRFALGLFALGALAMLLLSERTWKHHHVTVILPLAWLLGCLAGARRRRDRALAALGLGAALIGQSLSGSGILGDRGSDLFEAYGCFTVADLLLFAAVALTLRAAPTPPAPDPR